MIRSDKTMARLNVRLEPSPTLADLVRTHGGIVFGRSALGNDEVVGLTDPRLAASPGDLQVHSGSVRAGDLFAALPGLKADGVRFIPDAASRGAALLLVPASRSLGAIRRRIAQAPQPLSRPAASGGTSAPFIWLHPRAKEIVGELAAQIHGRPALRLSIAGVTGTNGKTSVCHLAAQLLESAGMAPAVLGTAGHTLRGKRGPVHIEASHTTPDATAVQRLLARHVGGGGDCAVMEASSHALVQGRLAGMRLKVGAFTNLTREHLDYHRTMGRYAEAKARLWDCVEPGGYAVICGADAVAEDMANRAVERGLQVLRVAIESEGDLVATDLVLDERGARFKLTGLGAEAAQVQLPLRGVHNVENALVAAAIAHVLGAATDSWLVGLSELSAAPGRLEVVPLSSRHTLPAGPFEVLVDYAHSPDALERVLGSLRHDLAERAQVNGAAQVGRLICVFGCGGDRDRGKRAPMGRAAGELSDVAIVTSDNPRSEDPAAIADAVVGGVDEVGGRRIVELDRGRAIERALHIARSGDIVLIAGKGHENTQLIGGRSLPFDDRVVASEAFARLAEAAQ